MKNKFDLAIASLIGGASSKSEGSIFYGSLIQRMKRIKTDSIPTMGVSVTTTINLYYNEKFVNETDLFTLVEVLKHECDHIISNHVLRFSEIPEGNHKLFNLASDACINKNYKKLQEQGVTVEKIKNTYEKYVKEGKLNSVKIDDNQPAEYYYAVLELMKENTEGCGDTIDDHSKWEETGGVPDELRTEALKNEVKKAVENTSKLKGNIPYHMQHLIDNIGKKSVNWKQVLNQFISRVNKSKKDSTRMKRNRRYGFAVKGKKKLPDLKIACCLDTSGSVSNEYLNQYVAELLSIHDSGIEILVIEADCQVQENGVYTFDPKKVKGFSGRGGTAYMPAINEAMKHEVDAILYMGDGDIFGEELINPNIPFLWVMIEDNKPPASWGKVCNIYRNK